MITRTGAAFALVLPFLAACGGAAAQAPAPGETPAAKPAGGGKTVADMKRDFMGDCSSKIPNAPDYCECSWEQMTRTFSEDEMRAPEADKEKLATFTARLEATCKSKLPEDVVKAGFVKACSAGEPRLGGYCECTWGSFRKQLSASELNDAAVIKSERFTTAKKLAVKTCGSKLPDDIARDHFFAGCSSNKGELKAFCGCAWKAVRGIASAAEIEASTVDLGAIKPVVEKSCGKLRPAAAN